MATIELIKEAITALKDRTGSSIVAITKFIESEKKQNVKKHILKAALKRGVETGTLVQVKNSYKVSAEAKKKPTKPAVAAKPKVVKKTTEKKSATAKKPATKKKPTVAKKATTAKKSAPAVASKKKSVAKAPAASKKKATASKKKTTTKAKVAATKQ